MELAFGVFILGAATLVAIWVICESSSSSPKHQDESEHSSDPTNTDENIAALRADIHRFVKNDEIYKQEQRTAEQRKEWRESRTAAGVWAYTILTAGLLVIGTWSLEANKRQIAQTQIISRARIGIESIEKFALAPSEKFGLILHIKNFGGTTAFNVTNAVVLHSLLATETFTPVYGETSEESSHDVMEAGGTGFLPTKTFPITKEQIDAVADKRFTLYLYGKIDYDDVYGDHHQMTFCREVISQELVKSCGTYNNPG